MKRSAAYSFISRDRCPVGLSQDVRAVYESPFTQGPIAVWLRGHYGIDPFLLSQASFALVRCDSCTLLYQKWVGDDHPLSELYGTWIHDGGDPAHDELYRHVMRYPSESRDGHELLTAAAFLGKSPVDTVTLDFGMGWAMWALVALAIGCTSVGTELSPARVRFARQHGVRTLGINEIPAERFGARLEGS